MQKIVVAKTAATRTAATTKTVKTVKTIATSMAATMTKKRDERVPAPTKRAVSIFSEPSDTDVNGSYTGRPKNKREIPVQDADDL